MGVALAVVIFWVWTILEAFGCKLRVLALLFGVLKLGLDEICSIVEIKCLKRLPCELERVWLLSELGCFLVLTNSRILDVVMLKLTSGSTFVKQRYLLFVLHLIIN